MKDAEIKVSDGTVTVPIKDFPGFVRVKDQITGEDLTQHYSVNAKSKKGKISVAIS